MCCKLVFIAILAVNSSKVISVTDLLSNTPLFFCLRRRSLFTVKTQFKTKIRRKKNIWRKYINGFMEKKKTRFLCSFKHFISFPIVYSAELFFCVISNLIVSDIARRSIADCEQQKQQYNNQQLPAIIMARLLQSQMKNCVCFTCSHVLGARLCHSFVSNLFVLYSFFNFLLFFFDTDIIWFRTMLKTVNNSNNCEEIKLTWLINN